EESMQQLAAIVEHSNDAIMAVRPGGEIIAWNPAAESLYGYSAEEAIGQNILVTVPPDRQEEAKSLIQRSDGGEGIQNVETAGRRAEGREGRAAVIAEAVPVLDSSLEFEVVVRNLVGLTVPNLSDWGAIHMAHPEGGIRLLAVGHSDSSKEEHAWELDRTYPA